MSNLPLIHAAYGRLKPVVRKTPLLSAPFLDALAGRKILVKAECLQHTGSFKFRGAYAALSNMDAAKLKRGVIAYSSGNHAQGVALAARMLGASATIIMPADAPVSKIENTKALGAEVVLYARATEDRDEIGARLSEARGLTLVKPFDDAQVIAGQASVGLEIAAQCEADMVEVLVPCGGGGLTSGVALALAETRPNWRVYPVEPEGFDDVARSLVSGKREKNTRRDGSVCDAIITPVVGEITFPILQKHCASGLVVSEDEALAAMALAFAHLKLVIEPGGAVALAAVLFHGEKLRADTVIVVASGGNVDVDMFCRALGKGALPQS
ncbi:MAG: threonine/serine dehydratase [Rhodobacteraceae bacterium]|nr:threonine/serine dehydratase [Paracoccaceae bacterium]